jgi:hypothetical protein
VTPGSATTPDVAIAARKTLRNRRLVVWTFFGLIFGLLPLLIKSLTLLNDEEFTWGALLSSREQFLVLSVLSVGAAGEVIAASVPEDSKTSAITAAASALLAFTANLLVYVGVSSSKTGLLEVLTVILLPLSVLASMICIGMAAGR